MKNRVMQALYLTTPVRWGSAQKGVGGFVGAGFPRPIGVPKARRQGQEAAVLGRGTPPLQNPPAPFWALP